MKVFSKLISGIELNHKNSFQNYLIDRYFELVISESKIEGFKNDKMVVNVKFDQMNRLVSLNGEL